MQIVLGSSEQERVLEFASLVEFDEFFAAAELKGSFFLAVDSLPPNCVLIARCLDSPRSRRIRPIGISRISGGHEVRTAVIPDAPRVPLQEPRLENPQSLHDQIRALSVTERVALALKADLIERRILMQENNSKINEFLLRNVRITDGEIAFMARNPSSPMQTILAIANHKDWMARESIRGALLSNPRTPPAMAMDMIPGLSSLELLRMSNSRHLREDVQKAVGREMKKRGLKPKRLGD